MGPEQAQATLQQLVVLLAGLAETRPDQDATLRALFCVATVLAPLAYPATERTLAGEPLAYALSHLTSPALQLAESAAQPQAWLASSQQQHARPPKATAVSYSCCSPTHAKLHSTAQEMVSCRSSAGC